MIISRTPFRVSLAGGGSDIAEYYRNRPGNVVTLAINRYMYVTVNRRFDHNIRVSYTRTEIVEHLDDLQHELIREALRMTGFTNGIEVTTVADLPAGIGLGSSSTLVVGVLNALYALKGEWHSPDDLASRACEIEIRILGHPIGKQDQYIAAFGGLSDISFLPDERVSVRPIVCPNTARQRLIRQLMLFFTGVHRDAGSVLTEARARLAERSDANHAVDGLVALAAEVRAGLVSGKVGEVGAILDKSWTLKKRMASTVSNSHLDDLYLKAREAGADGGKVAGAGGGGCLLLVVKPSAQKKVRDAMTGAGLREITFSLEPEGSRIIHYGRIREGTASMLSIVVPCFNEADNAPTVERDLLPVARSLATDGPVEIVFVDDGSTDGTLATFEALCARHAGPDLLLRVVPHGRNRGLGAALRTGLRAAHGDVLVTTDCDATYRFHEIPPLLARLTPDVDIVTASPYHPDGAVENVPQHRLVLSKGSSALYRVLVDWRVHCYTALFRAYRRRVLETTRFSSDGFLAGTEILVNAMLAGHRVVEHPTTLHSRVMGTSKAKLLRTIKAHLRFQARLLGVRLGLASSRWVAERPSVATTVLELSPVQSGSSAPGISGVGR